MTWREHAVTYSFKNPKFLSLLLYLPIIQECEAKNETSCEICNLHKNMVIWEGKKKKKMKLVNDSSYLSFAF